MLVHEAAVLLLRHLQRLEALLLLAQEAQRRVDRLILSLRLERNVFDADEVDLKRIQLLSIEVAEEWLLTLDLEVKIIH